MHIYNKTKDEDIGSLYSSTQSLLPVLQCQTQGQTPLLRLSGMIVATFVLAPLVTTASLGVLGFSAAGPVAGSIAAGLQAGIGSVVAGSFIAPA
ncbi:hypothetical protein V8E53_004233 [Lactarius tabidus]